MVRQLVLVAALFVLGAVDDTFAVDPDVIISGGRDARQAEFPYQVSLRKDNKDFCGGSLISNEYVLTAAHCVIDDVIPPFTGYTVVTGTTNLTGGEHHRIRNVVLHPSNYDLEHNIAIIRLDAPITPNRYQSTIRLASSDPPEGALLILCTWGDFNDSAINSRRLKTPNVTAMSLQRCNEYWGGIVDDTQLCASSPINEDDCFGSSGGPLVYNGEQVGIASAYGPCADGWPDIYIKVSHYLGFIKSVIQS